LRMELIQTAITKIVGCGATFLLGAQSLNALRQLPYGPNNLFRDNIRCHVAYAANDGLTQQEIARSCGTVKERRTSTSRTRSAGTWAGSRSETESEAEVPVMNAGDVREMPDDTELIFITGQPVIKAKKIRDYRDRILKKRLKLPPAPLRGVDGVYPDLPHPSRPSPWAGVLIRQEVREGAGSPVDDGDLPPPPDWDDDPAGDLQPVMAHDPARPRAKGSPKGQPKPRTRRLHVVAEDDE
jgi:hypothetical protein